MRLARVVAAVALGLALGFGWGYLMRCVSGTCPLTSNPWSGMIIGGVVGLVIALGGSQHGPRRPPDS